LRADCGDEEILMRGLNHRSWAPLTPAGTPRETSRILASLLVVACIFTATGRALAADPAMRAAPPVIEVPDTPPPAWTFRFVPYGWLISLNGSQTVRGRSVKVDASFADIVENSDSLVALMGTVEARNGPLAFYGDLVWSKIGVSESSVRTRTFAPGITRTVGTALDVEAEMAIAEVGVAYEVARLGPLAFDILGGARYWYQEVDLSLERARTLDMGDLELVGLRAVARSGSVDWLDQVIGARMRYAVAPGHELFLRGDVGGLASEATSPGRSSAATSSTSQPGRGSRSPA
jgi:hypothetical protein